MIMFMMKIRNINMVMMGWLLGISNMVPFCFVLNYVGVFVCGKRRQRSKLQGYVVVDFVIFIMQVAM